MPGRFQVTEAAARLARLLSARHGPLLFHLSGGCCEGSAPMCLRQPAFRAGSRDVLLGEVEGCPFYVSAAHYPVWADADITLDVLPQGGGDSFSLEAAEGSRFIVRSWLGRGPAPPGSDIATPAG